MPEGPSLWILREAAAAFVGKTIRRAALSEKLPAEFAAASRNYASRRDESLLPSRHGRCRN
jgi:hypothetical protein